MSVEMEHDWQSVFASPKPKLGERTKTNLLLLLSLLWVCFGLVGHGPWKPDEMQSISIVKHFLEGGHWTTPMLAGEPFLEKPPLYYLSAAAFAELFSGLLAPHDAARLATGLWMALTLTFVGMTGRELWGMGSGRQATLIFLSSIGLVFSAHTLNPDVAGLAGYAMGFYALALAPRRPMRAGFILGIGIGAGFLARGLMPLEALFACALLLPLFPHWRNRSYLLVLGIAALVALPWIGAWLIALQQQSPALLQAWLAAETSSETAFGYFANLLAWYSWPALPLALWTLWRLKPGQASVQLPLLFLLVLFLVLGLSAGSRDIHALPLLLPITLLATPAVDTLRRSAASALDWFGVMLFGTFGFLVWLGWFAMMTGMPARLAERMHELSSAYVPSFDPLFFSLALALTLVWAGVVFKANKRSNRAAVTDWAVGMTMVWGLVMTLWLPWLDAMKSYDGTFRSLQAALPARYDCITARNLSSSQRGALDYHASLQVKRYEATRQVGCDLYLIQDERGQKKLDPGPDWKMIWKGKRPSDRHESFRLFQRH